MKDKSPAADKELERTRVCRAYRAVRFINTCIAGQGVGAVPLGAPSSWSLSSEYTHVNPTPLLGSFKAMFGAQSGSLDPGGSPNSQPQAAPLPAARPIILMMDEQGILTQPHQPPTVASEAGPFCPEKGGWWRFLVSCPGVGEASLWTLQWGFLFYPGETSWEEALTVS